MTPGSLRLPQRSSRIAKVSLSRQALRRRAAVFLTASSANWSSGSTARLAACRYSMRTSLAFNKASASTAHILGCGTLVIRPNNRHSRKGGMAAGPQAANSSIAN